MFIFLFHNFIFSQFIVQIIQTIQFLNLQILPKTNSKKALSWLYQNSQRSILIHMFLSGILLKVKWFTVMISQSKMPMKICLQRLKNQMWQNYLSKKCWCQKFHKLEARFPPIETRWKFIDKLFTTTCIINCYVV